MFTIASFVFGHLILGDDKVLMLLELFTPTIATSIHGLDEEFIIISRKTIDCVVVNVAKESICELITQIVDSDFTTKTIRP